MNSNTNLYKLMNAVNFIIENLGTTSKDGFEF